MFNIEINMNSYRRYVKDHLRSASLLNIVFFDQFAQLLNKQTNVNIKILMHKWYVRGKGCGEIWNTYLWNHMQKYLTAESESSIQESHELKYKTQIIKGGISNS